MGSRGAPPWAMSCAPAVNVSMSASSLTVGIRARSPREDPARRRGYSARRSFCDRNRISERSKSQVVSRPGGRVLAVVAHERNSPVLPISSGEPALSMPPEVGTTILPRRRTASALRSGIVAGSISLPAASISRCSLASRAIA